MAIVDGSEPSIIVYDIRFHVWDDVGVNPGATPPPCLGKRRTRRSSAESVKCRSRQRASDLDTFVCPKLDTFVCPKTPRTPRGGFKSGLIETSLNLRAWQANGSKVLGTILVESQKP